MTRLTRVNSCPTSRFANELEYQIDRTCKEHNTTLKNWHRGCHSEDCHSKMGLGILSHAFEPKITTQWTTDNVKPYRDRPNDSGGATN